VYLDPVTEYFRITKWIATLVDNNITPRNFVRRLGKHLNSNHTVRVKCIQAGNDFLDQGDFTIGAEYDPDLDQQNKKQIIINFFINHNKILPWTITQEIAGKIALDLTEALVHEYQHLVQYRKRKFKLQKENFVSKHANLDRKSEQEYLGNPDEIDAYAANIAARLHILKTQLNTVVTDKNWTSQSLDYSNYIKAFGKKHPVIVELRNKIQHNLQFLEDIDHGKIRRKSFPRPSLRRV